MPENITKKLDVKIKSQETNMWCWAASGEMVMEFLGTDVTQCDQANKRFGEDNCCDAPAPNKCVKGGWPEFEKYGFAYKRTNDSAVTWNQIVDNIDVKKSPIAFTWRWTGGGGHMMVCIGYQILANTKYVIYHDPWPPNAGVKEKRIKYTKFVSEAGKYSHWDDFYNIEKKPGGGMMNPIDDGPGQSLAIAAATPAANSLLAEITDGVGPGAVLDKKCSVAFLRLDEILEFAKAPAGPQDITVESLLSKKPSTVVFSSGASVEITVDEDSVSGEWDASGFGEPDLIPRIVESGAAAPGGNETEFAVLTVLALNQQFLILNQLGGPLYRPLVDDPVNQFNVAESLTMAELAKRLVTAALKHDGQPR